MCVCMDHRTNNELTPWDLFLRMNVGGRVQTIILIDILNLKRARDPLERTSEPREHGIVSIIIDYRVV